MDKTSSTIKLSNGVEIPQLGLGVWQIKDEQVGDAINSAFGVGYRHIDTARIYQNESGVGRAISKSKISRDRLFVTTKLFMFDFFRAKKAFLESLSRLQLDYVDLYLIHWPFFGWKNAWLALEKIYKEGKTRSIGVSNFSIDQLKSLKKLNGIVPMVNQVEISPFLNRQDLVAYCQSEGIVIEAYSPLTRGRRINDSVITDISLAYKKSAAQIMLRWGIQHNLVVLPKSKNPDHIKNNIDIFDFEIDASDMKKLDSLNENYSALFGGWSRK